MKCAVLVFVTVAVFGAIMRTGLSQIPIPHRPPRGFVYNGSTCDAPVEFKAFIDLTCPDCKQAWPTFMKVAEYYNRGAKSQVSFEALIFPLPYHRAAFPAAQASYILRSFAPEKAYTWFTYIFDNQAGYYNSAILDKSQAEVHNMLANDIATSTGVAKSEILAHFKDSDPSRSEEIVMWKYGCSRTASGTPTVFINGARVEFDLTWTLADWRKVIDPLLTPEDTFYMPKTCPKGEPACHYLPGKVECCLKGENCIPNVGCRC